MKIYIIRHGITDWNVLGKWQGNSNIPLNDDGIKQAEALAIKLKNYQFKKIYSSPLVRAYKTAEIINKYKNIQIITHDDLKETNVGDWEGRTIHELRKSFKEIFTLWEKGEEAGQEFGVESYPHLSERAWNIFSKIAETEDDDLIIVTHGAWTKTILCRINNIPLKDRYSFDIDNTSITTINYNKIENKYNVLKINDIDHIIKKQS